MIKLPNQANRTAQKGFVSIVVTMILIIVLSLIVLGFSQLARREQREALDKQLSTQAFYAAEAGINDAQGIIKDFPSLHKPSCDTNGVIPAAAIPRFSSLNTELDPASGTGYTCLTIDATPDSFEFDSVGIDQPTITRISNGNDVNSLKISWNGEEESNTFRTGPGMEFPPVGSWGSDTGVLRVMLVPLDNLSRDSLVNDTFTVFLYPQAGGSPGSVSYTGSAASGSIINGGCDAGGSSNCSVTINNLSASGYMIVLKSFYKTNSVTIEGFDNGGNRVGLEGGQSVIDVTGKANDVLRRVRVHVPAASFNPLFGQYAMASMESLCKRLIIAPPNVQDDPASECPTL